jgi:hypothetical protein
MPFQTKNDRALIKSTEISGRMKYLAWIPLAGVLLSCGWLKRLLVRRRTPAELRAADKGRQSKVRRQLRGLPPVHDPHKDVS